MKIILLTNHHPVNNFSMADIDEFYNIKQKNNIKTKISNISKTKQFIQPITHLIKSSIEENLISNVFIFSKNL